MRVVNGLYERQCQNCGCFDGDEEVDRLRYCFKRALDALKHDVDPRWMRHSDECDLASTSDPHFICTCWVKQRLDLIAELECVLS